MRYRFDPRAAAAAIALLLGTLGSPTRAQEPALQKRVLVLYAMRAESPAFSIQERLYREGLAAAEGGVNYFSEFLDVHRFDDASYREAFGDFIRRKYRERHFDLIIANGPTDLSFAEELRPELFPGTPIVFAGVSARTTSNSAGFWYPFPMKGSIDFALRLQPETQHIVAVCGSSETDKYYEDAFKDQVKTLASGVTLTYECGRPVPELLETLAHLPPRSIVFFISMATDDQGNQFVMAEVSGQLAAAANAPIYSWNENFGGIFGGHLLSTEAVTQAAIRLALRVLGGESADSIPVATVNASVPQIDWRQLRRWNISESRVPPGTILRFREPSFFERYRGYFIGGIGLIALQSGLIAGLLIQLKRRRLAERSLRESEQRFRLLANGLPVMVWTARPDTTLDFVNTTIATFTGLSAKALLDYGWLEHIHPEDVDRCQSIYLPAVDARRPFQMEYRLRRADGGYAWVLDAGVPRYEPNGRFAGYIGSALDITERKEMEQQNHDLAGRLINAQESERARIARDLHDDLSQQLAGLAIMLSGLKRQVGKPAAETDVVHTVTTLQERTSALAQAVRNLSHDLHPSVLEHAGLVAAVKAHGAEVEQHHGVTVTVTATNDLDSLNPEVALCLFRVAQESLTNALRHARPRSIDVQLQMKDGSVELTVADDGVGFAAGERYGAGLGLRSIDERVRFAHGRVEIASQPGHGTTVLVRIPLPVLEAGLLSKV